MPGTQQLINNWQLVLGPARLQATMEWAEWGAETCLGYCFILSTMPGVWEMLVC